MRKPFIITVLGLFLASPSALFSQEPQELINQLLGAYGGRERIEAITSVEYETVGYFYGRYQSRRTEPPWDRIPIRHYIGVDFQANTSVRDVLSAWPGGLTMGYRQIRDGERSYDLNTIARLVEPGAMGGTAVDSAHIRFPAIFVRYLDENPEEITNIRYETRNGMEYLLAQYSDRTTLVIHPETYLILAMEYSATNHMAGRDMDYRREYRDYMEINGIIVPQRFVLWVDGLPYYDMSLPSVQFNTDISQLMGVPEGFEHVDSTVGYSGLAEIGVREIADGVFAAGNGETQILYVEFDDYWVAMEAGGFPSYAENVHQAMLPYMDDKPLRYIVPTHYHDDHLFAVHYYARIGATILTTRDKEPYIRELLNRTWGEHGPVMNAQFEFIEGSVRSFADQTNRFDVLVYSDAPHSENMLIGYVYDAGVLFSGDTVIGWFQPHPGHVRQGATYSARHLDAWTRQLQEDGQIGEIREYANVHGLPYSPNEWRQMLAMERTFIALPDNRAMPLDSWFLEYGLVDDSGYNPRRAYLPNGPTTH